MNNGELITKLNNAIWDLENAYEIRDIYCVAEDLKRIINELEGKNG